MSNLPKSPLKNASTSQNTPSPESPIQARIQSWKEKQAKEEPGVAFAVTQDKDNEKMFRLKPEVKKDIDLEDYKPSEVLRALYSAVSGSGNDEYSRKVIGEAMVAFNSNPNPKLDEISNAFHGAMLGMAPKDIVESQLCSRLLILNSRANHYMSLATTAEYQKVIDLNINRATKLMRLHNETLEALNRYRRKGEQRVKVVHQYVQVNEGGQAVVTGDVTRGRGKKKKVRV